MFCCPRCSHLSTILDNIVEPESGVTIWFIVDNCDQCVQQNIIQSCFHQVLQQPDRLSPCTVGCFVVRLVCRSIGINDLK
jgi:hypothetical protein